MLGSLKPLIKKTVSRYKVPVSLAENVSPVFIIASGRSGNTLLRRILCSGPELYIPPETYVLGQIIRKHPSRASLPWSELCQLTLGAFATSEDFHTFPSSHLHTVYEQLVAVPAAERSLALIITAFYEYMMRQAKPTALRWGDKTPLNAQSLPQIDEAFPIARYIHIIRDGYDVVASYLKMGRYSDPEEAARRWIAATDDCHNFAVKHARRVMEIRYEDLCRQPIPTTQSICSFLGLTYSSDMLETTPAKLDELGDISVKAHYSQVRKPISTASIGKGRAELSGQVLKQLQPILSIQMAKFGYE